MSNGASDIINDKAMEEIQNGSDLEDSNALFSKDSLENSAEKEERIIRKAKRMLINGPDGGKEGVAEGGITAPRVQAKNSRRSRNGFVRGLPKKGGAGGKGVWGLPGSELMASDEAVDENDPNYDPDEVQDGEYIVDEVDPEIAEEDIGKVLEPLLLEYLENGIATEVEVVLKDINFGAHKHRIVETAVSLAMEKHDAQRELVSRLLLFLVNHNVLAVADVVRAFEVLLTNLADITLDTPNAPTMLGQFIARAIVNDCLPDTFILDHVTVQESDIKVALNKAEVLLKMNNGLTRLENIWGVGDGSQSYLSNQMVMVVKEYLASADMVEATRRLMELDVPHYHHELVYQAIKLAIEEYREHAIQHCAELLRSLTTSNIITPDQLDKGIQRLLADMSDISIDVPAAYSLLEMMSNLLLKYNVIKDTLIKESPLRGRKRFVSEGDGGRFKYH